MNPDGSCPVCGRVLADPLVEDEPKAPWHFKLLVAAVAVYLLWRLVQLITWIVS